MGFSIDYSNAAERDLKDVFSYSRDKWGSALALDFMKKIGERIKHLSMYPELGRMCQNLKGGVRYFLVADYFVFYRIENKFIFIFRVLHSRENSKRLHNFY